MEPLITYYEVSYSVDKDRIKKLITIDLNEAKIKTSEVLQDANSVHLQFQKLSGTKAEMLAALKKVTQCL